MADVIKAVGEVRIALDNALKGLRHLSSLNDPLVTFVLSANSVQRIDSDLYALRGRLDYILERKTGNSTPIETSPTPTKK
jgi:hypothetical protein